MIKLLKLKSTKLFMAMTVGWFFLFSFEMGIIVPWIFSQDYFGFPLILTASFSLIAINIKLGCMTVSKLWKAWNRDYGVKNG
jgi:hypothetical protein